ncbi:MAG: hypothetical protein IPK12_20455 [Gemmatimonadetes bacterium]|nr:hypothetical protein [Gemmatimonadota bacterium]
MSVLDFAYYDRGLQGQVQRLRRRGRGCPGGRMAAPAAEEQTEFRPAAKSSGEKKIQGQGRP